MNKVIAAAVAALLLISWGCASHRTQLTQAAAGHVPCATSEIEYQDDSMVYGTLGGATTWEVVCRGRRYQCAANGRNTSCIQL